MPETTHEQVHIFSFLFFKTSYKFEWSAYLLGIINACLLYFGEF